MSDLEKYKGGKFAMPAISPKNNDKN